MGKASRKTAGQSGQNVGAAPSSSESQAIAKIVDEIRAARADASDQLSSRSRTIGLGVLALVWLLVGGTEQILVDRFSGHTTSLLAIAGVCIVAMACDFLQYATQLAETQLALNDSEKATRLSDAGYDDPSWWRYSAMAFFILKHVAVAAATVWLLWIMFSALTEPPPGMPTKPSETQSTVPKS